MSNSVAPRLLGLGLAAALLAAPATARADEVFFSGSAAGYFNGLPSPTPTCAGLTYLGSNFNGTTSNGFLGIGATAATPNQDNLGSFTLSGTAFNYNTSCTPGMTGPNTFTLLVSFTAPAGITGGQTATYQAIVTGSVTASDMGGVFIDFNNNLQTFTFANGTSTGTFQFAVNDLNVTPGQTAALTGRIVSATQTTVPEPASMTLLATGLAGLGAAARRRKNQK